MARSITEGFDEFLRRLTPLQSQREASARHRSSIESALSTRLSVRRFRETGSFNHGTGVRNYCDVDLMVSIGGGRPSSSDTAIQWVKDALTSGFPYTPVRVSRPAVVVDFAQGRERWEVIPAFLTSRGGADVHVYDIPGPAGGWIDSAPSEHLDYVTEINGRDSIKGGAKKLSRLAKAWKYHRSVPVSSFYLEMRAAQYMNGQSYFGAVWDICGLLEDLHGHDLASMNDPKGASGRIHACSSDAKKSDALSKLSTAATRARKALDAHRQDDPASAFYYLDLLFGGQFPAR